MKILFATLFVAITAMGADWYVAPTGTAGGAGTLIDPISLSKAFAINTTSPAQAGDTIYLRGGTYPDTDSTSINHWWKSLLAPVGAHITVQPYAGETPILEATATNHYAIEILGSNVWFNGITFWNSGLPREERSTGLHIRSPGVRVINCVIHDTGQGIYLGEESTNAVIYGNLIYNCGDASATQKHSIYAHSEPPGTTIQNNITLGGYYVGLHLYSEVANQLYGFTVKDNTCVESGILRGGSNRSFNILLGGTITADMGVVAGNLTYHSAGTANNVEIGYSTTENGTVTITNNYIAGNTFTIQHWTNLVFTGNVAVNITDSASYNSSSGVASATWDNNTYLTTVADPFKLNGTTKSWADWKTATGFDASSTWANASPVATVYFLRTNVYKPSRITATVYNWAGTDNVAVDLSGLMAAGGSYSVFNAWNVGAGSIMSGVYGGGTISLPMTNLVAATPVGGTVPASTGPTFNVFILESTPPPSTVSVQMRYGQLKGSP